MKTFKLECAVDMTVTVPDTWIKQLRIDAQSEAIATPFLIATDGAYPNDDEEFAKAILKNGIRHDIRASLSKLMAESGLGVRLAPASVKVIDNDVTTVEGVLPTGTYLQVDTNYNTVVEKAWPKDVEQLSEEFSSGGA